MERRYGLLLLQKMISLIERLGTIVPINYSIHRPDSEAIPAPSEAGTVVDI